MVELGGKAVFGNNMLTGYILKGWILIGRCYYVNTLGRKVYFIICLSAHGHFDIN